MDQSPLFHPLLKVVSRKSSLAIIQVEEIFRYFSHLKYELLSIDSYGDKNKQISLMGNISTDFFTKELDEILLTSKADLAIHSAKDLPYPLPHGLTLAALIDSQDETDSLVSRDHKLADLPINAKVGTSSINRKNELLRLRPDLEIVSIRGTIEERIACVDNGTIDAVIVATCALKRLGLENRITEVLPFKTHPLQGKLAVVVREGNETVASLFESKDIRSTYGAVTLVGFGPGDPDLLTIAGDKALSTSDIIFYDDLLDESFLNKYKAEKVYVGKRRNKHSYHQDDINELLYQAAINGKKVVRLKGGDSMIFAHGREEIDYLQSRHIIVNVVSGISAGIALAACTHIPLTHRGVSSSVCFVTGHSKSHLKTPRADTLVYYMGGANMREIASALINDGWNINTPVALVHNVSLKDQKTYFSTLYELKDTTIEYPTPILIIIGDVVNLESGTKPSILVTGTTKEEYEHLGNVIHTPLIKITESDRTDLLREGLSKLETFDWLIFTSRYGVKYFFEWLRKEKKDIRKLSNSKIASVGKTTTLELENYNIYPELESATESAEGLIEYFKLHKINNQKILLPRSDKGLKYLSEKLIELGNDILDMPIYKNSINTEAAMVDLSRIDQIVFASPSTIDAFIELYGYIPTNVKLVTKGKTTEEYLKNKIK